MGAGRIEAVVYFRCYDTSLANPPRPPGYLLIAPYTDCPTPSGYERCEALYLNDVYKLEKTLVAQEMFNARLESDVEQSKAEARSHEISSRLYQRLLSNAVCEEEKAFIREWIKLRDNHPRKALYTQRITEAQMYLHALHFDTPAGRRVDEEKVSVDRINVRT